MKYLEGLNEKQREAVLEKDGPISVLAGAGSGKTRVLTTRIYHLIREGVLPEKILAVTFTNKAAREMRERLGKMLGEDLQVWKRESAPFVATFHGLGRELLEQYGQALGVPRHFSIFDRDDSERAIKNALKELGIDPKEVTPRSILSRISKAKGAGQTLLEFKEKGGREGFRSNTAANVWEKYEETLRKERALDFDDLVEKPVRLLEEYADVRALVADQFHYIHIDEFQDTNELQGRLVSLLGGARKNIFVVGDIDQCVYTWRGATIDNLLSFEKTYPEARTIVLEHNYRSTKTIVDAANRIIEENRNRKEKRSVTDNEAGDPIHIHAATTADLEAAFIAKESKRLIHKGASPEEIAVLYRTNFQSRALEEAFLREGIPYRLLGTQFYDRKEVKDVISWVRLALAPEREADRMRAVQAPARGIGKITLAKLLSGKSAALKPSEHAKVAAFEHILLELATAAKTLAPSEFVRLVIESSGMRAAYEKGGEDDLERLQNIEELVTLASRYDNILGEEGIAAFLSDVALAGDQDEIDRPTRRKDGTKGTKEKKGVTLMTVHAAKGLEFDVVFVSGLEEGLFPHEGMADEERDEEEERRLFYVAITRARKRLYLTFSRVRRIYGTDYLQEPSCFLQDLDPSTICYVEDEGDTIHI